ncbi:MAG: hypothetical protein AAGB10_10615 [Pseudomonadota bacterium]
MSKPVLVLAVLGGAYLLYTEYGGQLPSAPGPGAEASGNISAIANSPGVVTSGVGAAAQGVVPAD